jgi:hypothetical protein
LIINKEARRTYYDAAEDLGRHHHHRESRGAFCISGSPSVGVVGLLPGGEATTPAAAAAAAGTYVRRPRGARARTTNPIHHPPDGAKPRMICGGNFLSNFPFISVLPQKKYFSLFFWICLMVISTGASR